MFSCCGYSIVEEKDAELLNEIKDDNFYDNLYLKKEGNKEAGEGTIEIVSFHHSKRQGEINTEFEKLKEGKKLYGEDINESMKPDFCIIMSDKDGKDFLFINSEEILALSEIFKKKEEDIAKSFFNKCICKFKKNQKTKRYNWFICEYGRYYDREKDKNYPFQINDNGVLEGSGKAEGGDWTGMMCKINWKDFEYLVDEVAKKIMGKRMKEIQNSRINLKDSKNKESNYNFKSLDGGKRRM